MNWFCAFLWFCGAVVSYSVAFKGGRPRCALAVIVVAAVWPVLAIIGFVAGILRSFDIV